MMNLMGKFSSGACHRRAGDSLGRRARGRDDVAKHLMVETTVVLEPEPDAEKGDVQGAAHLSRLLKLYPPRAEGEERVVLEARPRHVEPQQTLQTQLRLGAAESKVIGAPRVRLTEEEDDEELVASETSLAGAAASVEWWGQQCRRSDLTVASSTMQSVAAMTADMMERGEQAAGRQRHDEERRRGCRMAARRSSLTVRVAKKCDLGQRPEATGWLAQAEVPREGLAGHALHLSVAKPTRLAFTTCLRHGSSEARTRRSARSQRPWRPDLACV